MEQRKRMFLAILLLLLLLVGITQIIAGIYIKMHPQDKVGWLFIMFGPFLLPVAILALPLLLFLLWLGPRNFTALVIAFFLGHKAERIADKITDAWRGRRYWRDEEDERRKRQSSFTW